MEKKGKVYNKDEYFLISKRELRRLARCSGKDFRWEVIKTFTWNMLREHTENQWKLAEEGKYYAILDRRTECELSGMSYDFIEWGRTLIKSTKEYYEGT